MQWTKTDPENLPKGRVVYANGKILDIGYFGNIGLDPQFNTKTEYHSLENSYYIELPPLPEAK